MKIGIDSYCFHRFFGEVYPGQDKPEKEMTVFDFIDFAASVGCDGVSLESCFLPGRDDETLAKIKAKLDEHGLDRVYAWGHPDGLERGQNPEAFADMKEQIRCAVAIGADVMRVCGSSLMFRHEDHQPQIEALIAQFKEAIVIAEEAGVKLAIENHIDYTADEIMQIIEGVDSKYFGVNFDTGNFLRLLDDPIEGMRKLAPHVMATHTKDLMVDTSVPPTEWHFFAGVPVGMGLVDNLELARILDKADFQGFMAVEIDFPHIDWTGLEEEAVRISVKKLRQISNQVIAERNAA
jgi:sugar phosphate isomerase/epimerase